MPGLQAFVSASCTRRVFDSSRPDRVLYTPERLVKIAAEAAKQNSAFSLDDRIGLVHDSMALSKAGLARLSSALTLVDSLKNEKECKRCFVRVLVSQGDMIVRSGVVWHLRECRRAGVDLVGTPQDCGPAERLPPGMCIALPSL